MPNILSKVVSLILFVLLAFLVPMYQQFWAADRMINSQVNTVTNRFQKEVRNHGYVSEELYNTFTKELANTGRVFDITMLHREIKYYPLSTSDPGYTADKPYSIEYYKYDEKTILKTIYKEQKDYKMEVGDDFSVIVWEKNSLTGSNIFRWILTRSSNVNSIIQANYGGMVENEDY